MGWGPNKGPISRAMRRENFDIAKFGEKIRPRHGEEAVIKCALFEALGNVIILETKGLKETATEVLVRELIATGAAANVLDQQQDAIEVVVNDLILTASESRSKGSHKGVAMGGGHPDAVGGTQVMPQAKAITEEIVPTEKAVIWWEKGAKMGPESHIQPCVRSMCDKISQVRIVE
jgi:hypothetical protein